MTKTDLRKQQNALKQRLKVYYDTNSVSLYEMARAADLTYPTLLSFLGNDNLQRIVRRTTLYKIQAFLEANEPKEQND